MHDTRTDTSSAPELAPSSLLPADRLAWLAALRRWCAAWRPARQAVDLPERLRVAGAAALGIAVVVLLSRAWADRAGLAGLPWLVAPVGASAVLVYALPASPLAQPWAVVGGNTVSALAGLLCVHLLPGQPWALGLAVGLAISAMFAARCLHPPGGAVALLTAYTATSDWRFALAPVALNSALLVATALVLNPLRGRRYPHPQDSGAVRATAVAVAATGPAGNAGAAVGGTRFSDADLDAVLARYNQVLDLPRDDLVELLQAAELASHRRRLGALRCQDVMSANPLTVEFGTPLAEAWQRLRSQHIKALPVVDRYGHIVGILTQADFLRGLDLDLPDTRLATRLRRLVTPTPGDHSDKPEVVGQIMCRQVRVVSAERPLADLVPLFASSGHHHIPVITQRNRLVGIITQADLVAALVRPA